MVRLVEVEDNLMVVGMVLGDKLNVVGTAVEDKLKAEGEEGMTMLDMLLNLVGMKGREMSLDRLQPLMDKDLQSLVEEQSIERLGAQEVLHTVVLMVQSLFLVFWHLHSAISVEPLLHVCNG